MSTIHQISETHQREDSPETTARNVCLDLAGKFRIYRLGAESRERKLKNADAIIERLKDEISSSRDSEQNLRNQLSSAQNRLIYLQQALKELITISEQQRQNEKISQQIEERVEKISEAIKQTHEKSQSLLRHVSSEKDLMKEIENVKSVLAKKDREIDLMKMEIQALTTAKKNMETTNHQKLTNLEKELETLKQRGVDAEANYRETLIYYQQQLEEKEQTIKLYEKERMRFLDDFEPTKVSEIGSDNFKCADSTVFINSPERCHKASTFESYKSQSEPKESNTEVLRPSPPHERSSLISFGKRKDQNFSKVPKKQKLQLEFLMGSQHPSQITTSVKSGQKRRLFSTNCNHYTD